MGRKPAKIKSKRLPLTLIEPTYEILEMLVETGGYGSNATDAARIIVMLHIHALDSQGNIKLFSELPPNQGIKTGDKE